MIIFLFELNLLSDFDPFKFNFPLDQINDSWVNIIHINLLIFFHFILFFGSNQKQEIHHSKRYIFVEHKTRHSLFSLFFILFIFIFCFLSHKIYHIKSKEREFHITPKRILCQSTYCASITITLHNM